MARYRSRYATQKKKKNHNHSGLDVSVAADKNDSFISMNVFESEHVDVYLLKGLSLSGTRRSDTLEEG